MNDRPNLIRIIETQNRNTYHWRLMTHTASLCDIMKKSKEINQNFRRKTLDFHLFKLINPNTNSKERSSYLAAQDVDGSQRQTCFCVKFANNPRTEAEDLVKMLAEAGKTVSLSKVK
ncbi:hypothetical protein XENORESO_015985 [Xenotaenia resolanae]|uniref:LAGLIDADG homing endonuclease n=1 Tax=Xenotaenia resolanae TaxID=208358 RepID=A0ABV0WZ67_9TELE